MLNPEIISIDGCYEKKFTRSREALFTGKNRIKKFLQNKIMTDRKICYIVG